MVMIESFGCYGNDPFSGRVCIRERSLAIITLRASRLAANCRAAVGTYRNAANATTP